MCHCTMDLSNNKHWDHAYAQTVHASQGATQHRAIFHIRAPQTESEKKQERALENMAKVFGDRSFYVGATRASHELRIYTNDKAVAAKAVAAKQDKTSAVETLRQHERATAITPTRRENARCRRSETVTFNGNPYKMSTYALALTNFRARKLAAGSAFRQ